MKDLPYFKWWVADAEAEELYASLSLEELGLYHRCLNRSWISDGIPADTKALAAVIHISPSRLAKLWPSIAAKWSESTRDPTQ